MNPFTPLISAWKRALVFTSEQRNFFFILIREYTKNNFPMLDILKQVEQANTNKTVRRIARLGQRNVLNQRPFASNYHLTGYFTSQEEALLRLGERNDAMENTISLILSSDAHQRLPLKILGPSGQWLLMSSVMIFVANDMALTMKRFAGNFAWYFDLCQATVANLPLILGTVAGITVLYRFFRDRAGLINTLITRLGLNILHLQVTERKLLFVLKQLVATKIPPREIMNLLLTLFPDDKWLHVKIKKAQARIRHEPLSSALEDIVSKNVYLNIIASSPNREPHEMATGMEMSINIIDLHIDKQVAILKNIVMLIAASLAGLYLIPFMLVSLGAGATATPGMNA